MASGWGCQFLTKNEEIKADWCDRLKKVCHPGIKGCILDGKTTFTQPTFLTIEENSQRKVKKRSDNPLGER